MSTIDDFPFWFAICWKGIRQPCEKSRSQKHSPLPLNGWSCSRCLDHTVFAGELHQSAFLELPFMDMYGWLKLKTHPENLPNPQNQTNQNQKHSLRMCSWIHKDSDWFISLLIFWWSLFHSSRTFPNRSHPESGAFQNEVDENCIAIFPSSSMYLVVSSFNLKNDALHR